MPDWEIMRTSDVEDRDLRNCQRMYDLLTSLDKYSEDNLSAYVLTVLTPPTANLTCDYVSGLGYFTMSFRNGDAVLTIYEQLEVEDDQGLPDVINITEDMAAYTYYGACEDSIRGLVRVLVNWNS